MYRVILADDETWILRGLIKSFPWEREGFEVAGSFTDPALALETALRDKPDVLFVDIRMPGINGLEMITRLREAGLAAQFVVISGHDDFSYAQQALRLGAFDYCLKPLDANTTENLLPRLRKRLDELAQSPPVENVDEGDESAFERMLRYLNAHAGDQIELTELTDRFHINKSYACVLFKKRTGRTFSEYRNALRVERAQTLLRDTSLPIAEISERVGYPDSFYFSKLFKRISGTTPSEYRRVPQTGGGRYHPSADPRPASSI